MPLLYHQGNFCELVPAPYVSSHVFHVFFCVLKVNGYMFLGRQLFQN